MHSELLDPELDTACRLRILPQPAVGIFTRFNCYQTFEWYPLPPMLRRSLTKLSIRVRQCKAEYKKEHVESLDSISVPISVGVSVSEGRCIANYTRFLTRSPSRRQYSGTIAA